MVFYLNIYAAGAYSIWHSDDADKKCNYANDPKMSIVDRPLYISLLERD
jgi:hypothetical protein